MRRSPPNGPVPAPELPTVARASSSLLHYQSLVQWPLMSRVQRPAQLRPLFQDRLRRLPDASIFTNDFTTNGDENGAKDGSPAERRIRFLENSINFLRQEHAELLSALHQEVDSLKRTNQSTSYCVNYTSHKFTKITEDMALWSKTLLCYFWNSSVKSELILTIFGKGILNKLDTSDYTFVHQT